MGFTPAQVDAMGAWEFFACVGGYAAAHSGKGDQGEVGPEVSYSDTDLRDMGIEGF
jgi:hypothetical protein